MCRSAHVRVGVRRPGSGASRGRPTGPPGRETHHVPHSYPHPHPQPCRRPDGAGHRCRRAGPRGAHGRRAGLRRCPVRRRLRSEGREGHDGRAARPASVSGKARVSYAFSPDDEIWFTVDARAKPYSRPLPGTKAPDGLPTDAVGTIHYSHRVAATGVVYNAVAEVDCLSTGGPVATVTAVVTTSDIGNANERIGLSVYQGRGRDGDRLGFSWGVANLDMGPDQQPYQPVVGTCMAPAPFAPVLRGGFSVHHVELEAPKTPGR